MGNSMVAFFNGVRYVEIFEVSKPKDPKCVYRDELNKKKPSVTKDTNCFPSKEDGGRDDAKKTSSDLGAKGVTRVKLVLTKQEAALLLSKFKGGKAVLQDIVSELKRIEPSRVSVVPPGSLCDLWKPTLESIPEGS